MRAHKSSLANKLIPNSTLHDDDNIVHHFSKYVTLVEDMYGMLFDAENEPVFVKRFTWTNHNKISISVITYGARIISMKLPDRGGNVEEIVLGFDDLAGYIFYGDLHFGATMGRTTTKIFRSTYVVDGKQYWIDPNDGEHHVFGGERGLDKINWIPYVDGKVLHLSCMSPDGDEGYPGDLHVHMTFELTTGAEFRISITANTTKVTPVDISNMTYFNLAGHQAGAEEIRKHEILLNANCYTVMDEDNEFPTGEIQNVVHTRNNFQVPILLKKVMAEGDEAAYDQNFCVNRGVHQGEAFVARMVHPYKGRVLEIYSNQPGVNFSNGYNFPCGLYDIPAELKDILTPSMLGANLGDESETLFMVVGKLATYLNETMNMKPVEYCGFLRKLLKTFLARDFSRTSIDSFTSHLDLFDSTFQCANRYYGDFDMFAMLKPLEVQFLKAFRAILPTVTHEMPFEVVKAAIDDILAFNQAECDEVSDASDSFVRELITKQISELIQDSQSSGSSHRTSLEEIELTPEKSTLSHAKDAKPKRRSNRLYLGVPIPSFYKKDRITGRGGAIYKTYGGVALRTQNYPGATQHPRFPSNILRPNETYRHDITYKFWILAGNPAKWLRRLEVGPCVDVEDLSVHSSTTNCT